ncbi:MAG TPA: DUF4224 domain-containing protein [Candidatus Babeliales bacterium]|jgi:hypothetical protein|nr:DUF4224 domain-containing protein [Candidatus Babeliales bacterium]
MFLSQEDIQELTGYKKTALQIKWLRSNGFKFMIGADGRPRLLLSQLEALLGAQVKSITKRRVEPNFTKLEQAIHNA